MSMLVAKVISRCLTGSVPWSQVSARPVDNETTTQHDLCGRGNGNLEPAVAVVRTGKSLTATVSQQLAPHRPQKVSAEAP